MKKIVYWYDHETVIFAAEELKRLMEKCGSPVGLIEKEKSGDFHQEAIHLITAEQYAQMGGGSVEIKGDGFAIIEKDSYVWIVGKEPRSILYGVYQYCSNRFGYRWIDLAKETITGKSRAAVSIAEYSPSFSRRGNTIETINDPDYINALIDWGVKNKQNEYFFTFFLWDKVERKVAPGLQKRDVRVTLGGHSLKFLLEKVGESELLKGKKTSFFSGNNEVQEKVIRKIIEICLENKVIKRISLWPEDVGIDSREAKGFITSYIAFAEKLKAVLADARLDVEVEHIVYNAGLAWEMLEREDGAEASHTIDILYAYWGRDYSESLCSEDPNQVRATHALKDWNEQARKKGRSLTVLEYYSDHFMLSQLFPPLLNRIHGDLKDYGQMNIGGVLNLIVPLHVKPNAPDLEKTYPWRWGHQLNNYVYTRLAWGEEYGDILDDYFSLFGDEKELWMTRILQLEKVLSPHTKWNVPLFPARVVDPEKVEASKVDQEIYRFLGKVHELLAAWDLSDEEVGKGSRVGHENPICPKEKLKIYLSYLKKIVERYREEWQDAESRNSMKA
ncbi:alpha-glucuronidase family glycosyl hydrolase [Falsibacillus pallidus]|uniref:Glycosyl hydrolase family 67 n=1 Tax=Falsibacillus pallidus TaxID=493781 RepID=A0A370G8C7_9BACI|nr:alpha-glucuronidase family glycosyl hydrolase [Falsibacillus pallidus]RDI40048.1 glycosyl hydrolase family 67 [Falsibacillus pallidus]